MEIHRYGATTFTKVFSNTKFKGKDCLPFILGATATLQRQDGRHSIIEAYCPIISNIGFEEALDNKWICDFEIINIGVNAPNDYIELNNIFRNEFSYFHDNLQQVFSCLYYPSALKFVQDNNLDIDIGVVIGKAKRCLEYMRKRKQLIYESKEKLLYSKKLIEENKGAKIMTFSMSVNFANELTNLVEDSISIHSKLSDRQRDLYLSEFENGKYTVLNSVKIFEEGYDAPDVTVGINISCTAVDRQFIQRLGRLLRFVEGKKAIFYCLYLKGTKEKWTLKNAQGNIPNVKWI